MLCTSKALKFLVTVFNEQPCSNWISCSNSFLFPDTGVSWKDKTLYRRLRIQGEWIKFNCAIETSEKVTLWYGENMGETTKKLQVDNKKIKLIAENVFNMTNLTTNDEGWYTCEVCGKKHNSKLLKVSGQGNSLAE